MHIMVKLGFVRIWGHGDEGMRVMYGVMREGVGRVCEGKCMRMRARGRGPQPGRVHEGVRASE